MHNLHDFKTFLISSDQVNANSREGGEGGGGGGNFEMQLRNCNDQVIKRHNTFIRLKPSLKHNFLRPTLYIMTMDGN